MASGVATVFAESPEWPGQERYVCDVCGAAFWRYPHRNRGDYVACSHSCANLAQSWRHAEQAYLGVRHMTDLERGWLAAAIDGEGCLSYVKAYPRITIVNTSLPFLERAQEITASGTIRARKRQAAHHKPSWSWSIDGYGAVAVLEQVVGDLIVKQERAITALATRLDSVAKLNRVRERAGRR